MYDRSQGPRRLAARRWLACVEALARGAHVYRRLQSEGEAQAAMNAKGYAADAIWSMTNLP